MSTPPSPPPPPPVDPPPAALPPIERVRAAYGQRAMSDYVFTNPGWNMALTLLTCGIFGLYLFYQLMRRDRDHNRRRLELLDAATTCAWQQATDRGFAEELRPAFERVATGLDTMRRLAAEFRDPGLWIVISLFASGIAQIVGYIFIDQDLDTHDRAEGAVEAELAPIFTRLGHPMAAPDPSRVKGRHNYFGRVIATLLTCGVYHLWWLYDLQVEGNRHVEANWPSDDALRAAVVALTA
jgi:hypothetical protein